MTKEFIIKQYSEFIDLVINLAAAAASKASSSNSKDKTNSKRSTSPNLLLKRIVLITPPRILTYCSGFRQSCYAHNLTILEHNVVPAIREIYQKYSNNNNNSGGIQFQLIDFYQLMTQFYISTRTASSDETTSTNAKIRLQDDQQQEQQQLANNISFVIQPWFQQDGVHLSVQGHRFLGDVVWKNVSALKMAVTASSSNVDEADENDGDDCV